MGGAVIGSFDQFRADGFPGRVSKLLQRASVRAGWLGSEGDWGGADCHFEVSPGLLLYCSLSNNLAPSQDG